MITSGFIIMVFLVLGTGKTGLAAPSGNCKEKSIPHGKLKLYPNRTNLGYIWCEKGFSFDGKHEFLQCSTKDEWEDFDQRSGCQPDCKPIEFGPFFRFDGSVWSGAKVFWSCTYKQGKAHTDETRVLLVHECDPQGKLNFYDNQTFEKAEIVHPENVNDPSSIKCPDGTGILKKATEIRCQAANNQFHEDADEFDTLKANDKPDSINLVWPLLPYVPICEKLPKTAIPATTTTPTTTKPAMTGPVTTKPIPTADASKPKSTKIIVITGNPITKITVRQQPTTLSSTKPTTTPPPPPSPPTTPTTQGGGGVATNKNVRFTILLAVLYAIDIVYYLYHCY